MHARLAALAVSLALAAAPALAADKGRGMVSAADPEGVAAALQRLGYRAMLDTDSSGDPMIFSASSGVNFEIFFYECDGGRACRALQFSAGFDLLDPMPMERMNEWNATKRFGAAHVDEEGDPFLQYDVTTLGALTEENFADVVDWWRIALAGFVDHIGWQR